jgi:hypothetical protein
MRTYQHQHIAQTGAMFAFYLPVPVAHAMPVEAF